MEKIFLITTIVALIKWWIERIKFNAIIYYIADKEYTAPTKEELEQCIKIVAQKTTESIFKK
ncbi:MAG: hypothetical protein KH034_02865 [Lachnospiraceae bacterium]|nr:hypothetical protein [Lachnospiraceae bacterium]